MQEEMIMNMKAGHTISQIRQVSNRIFERILSERKIDAFNGAQGRILYVLWQEEQISLREVADRTGLAATTLTSMIDRMEAAGRPPEDASCVDGESPGASAGLYGGVRADEQYLL